MFQKSVNKVILVGRLGADPELRYTGSGTAVVNFRLATTESYKDANGEWQEKTEWHSLVVWSKLADRVNEYIRKGSLVYIEGSLQTRSWDDRDGNTRYTTEVKVREIQLLESKGNGDGSQSETASKPKATKKGGGKKQPVTPVEDDYSFEPDDDLPF